MPPPRKKKRKTNRDESSRTSQDATPKCIFCGRVENDTSKYGELLTNDQEKITTHHYCLLLSSGVPQRGQDHQGFYGFLYPDVRKAASQAAETPCTICKKRGASIHCSIKTCEQLVHFPCGQENEFIFQFYKQFQSFCSKHRPVQKITKTPKENLSVCTICLEELTPAPAHEVIKSPCCKNTWLHRTCLQMQALNAGKYHLKCPVCQNLTHFQEELLRMGIYIPHRDASWELEANAYRELLQVHEQCDVDPCLCDSGRNYSETGSQWFLIRCNCCGSSGTHLACSALSTADCTWTCGDCSPILDKPNAEEELLNDAVMPSTSSVHEHPAVTSGGETSSRVRGFKMITTRRTRRTPLERANPKPAGGKKHH
ncbi:G2/M phase-specific E3 ubiquitin-protein ligase-like [Pseudophryne corroboree]|uniref:G2/M phase-specific E3 ubiquitin-protein ligase-like n=1 Tax=Pseudophryne corroboree TaxID=495146 RepID=UPI003081434C